jgi:hypothetical protein
MAERPHRATGGKPDPESAARAGEFGLHVLGLHVEFLDQHGYIFADDHGLEFLVL